MIKCKACSYFRQSCRHFIECNFIKGRGNVNSDIVIVFDSPFYQDLQSEQIASSNEYNQYLNKYLNQIGLSMDDCYVTSFIKCYISDKKKKPTKPMKQKCFESYLDKEIREIKPKAILLIGKMVTSWFIPEVNTRLPLKQVVGKSFKNTDYNCEIIPIYDMYYLTNFTNKSAQIRQTEKGFACIKSALLQEKIAKDPKIKYSSNLEDLESLGEYLAVDIESLGLDIFKDKIITIALTDIKTEQTFSFDIEDYGGVEKCHFCNDGQKPNPNKVNTLKELNQLLIDKPKLKSTQNRIDKANELPDTIECEYCKGNGKQLKRNIKSNPFFTKVLPKCYTVMKKRKIVFQNADFDLQFLLKEGYDLCDNLVSDTRMMQFLINPLGGNALGFLIQLYFGIAYKEEIDRGHLLKMDMEGRRYYCAEDTYYTAKLFRVLYNKLKDQGSLVSNKIMTNTIKMISSDLEYRGILVDKNKINEIIDYYQAEKDKYELKFKKRFKLEDSFNLNSPKQLCKLLYEDLKLPILVRTKTKTKENQEGNPSINEEAIRKLSSKRPALNSLKDYRTMKGHIEKLIQYKESIKEDGRLHASFNLFSPDSSRMMCSKPNLANAPRESRIKEVFVADKGRSFVYFDVNQLEFGAFIHLTQDKKAKEFLNNKKDIHSFIASNFYKQPYEYYKNKTDAKAVEERFLVKSIVFGSMYLRTPEGIVKQLGGSLSDAEQIQRIFFQLCRESYFWLKQQKQKIIKNKKVTTLFGTPRFFNDLELATAYKKEEACREGISFMVQSFAVELVYIAMYKLWKKIREEKLDAFYVHNIYDACILSVKNEDVNRVKELVLSDFQNSWKDYTVPFTVDLKVGKSWEEVS